MDPGKLPVCLCRPHISACSWRWHICVCNTFLLINLILCQNLLWVCVIKLLHIVLPLLRTFCFHLLSLQEAKRVASEVGSEILIIRDEELNTKGFGGKWLFSCQRMKVIYRIFLVQNHGTTLGCKFCPKSSFFKYWRGSERINFFFFNPEPLRL